MHFSVCYSRCKEEHVSRRKEIFAIHHRIQEKNIRPFSIKDLDVNES